MSGSWTPLQDDNLIMITLLNGKTLAAELRQELKTKVALLPTTPKLGVILVGDDPASHLYVGLKQKAAAEVGIKIERVDFPNNTPAELIKNKLSEWNTRADIHGILIQFPLPPHLNEHEIVAEMSPIKDADGFHPENIKEFLSGAGGVTPGVSAGIMKLIDLAKQNLVGKTAVLLANSAEFAQPLVKLLQDRKVTTRVINTPETEILIKSDIIITALGQPHIITGDMIKDGAIVIDVGTTKVGNVVQGDVDANSLQSRNVYLTPVPGGVGPMTVVMLLWNVYRLAAGTKV